MVKWLIKMAATAMLVYSFAAALPQHYVTNAAGSVASDSISGLQSNEYITASKQEVVDHQDYLREWTQSSGVEFLIDPGYISNSNYTWSVADAKDHDEQISYYESMAVEINKYEGSFLSGIGLERVYFVDNMITHDGLPVLGFADVVRGELFLDIDQLRADTALVKSTLHHEIAHILFHDYYGSLMSEVSEWPEYQAKQTLQPYAPAPGFVNPYSQTSKAEDMAEVYAYMLTDELSQYLGDLVVSDDMIRQKVSIVESVLLKIDPDFIGLK